MKINKILSMELDTLLGPLIHFHQFFFCSVSTTKYEVKWFVHLLKVTAVTQIVVQTKANDRVWASAEDISPAVKGRIHGPVDEMFTRDE